MLLSRNNGRRAHLGLVGGLLVLTTSVGVLSGQALAGERQLDLPGGPDVSVSPTHAYPGQWVRVRGGEAHPGPEACTPRPGAPCPTQPQRSNAGGVNLSFKQGGFHVLLRRVRESATTERYDVRVQIPPRAHLGTAELLA